ncbi:MAG: RNA-processing protein [Thermoplasmatales archaeon]|nr:RNA-processing protein [Thermoplasmatales archaeon]
MKYLKIPMDRIGVLIGQKGETKKDLEEKTGLKINIDSNAGEIVIDDHETDDPLLVIKIENIVKAIGRGFSPEKAMTLMNDDADFFVFDLHDYVGKKVTHIKRLKSRVIGKEGKTKRVLEELTDAKISVYGHTVSIISDFERMNILKKSVDMLLTGSTHATVYRFVEIQMKELRRSKQYGF